MQHMPREERERGIPGDTPMEGARLQHVAQIMLCRGLLVRMDKVEDGLADDERGLFDEMVSEDGIEVNETEV